MLVLLIGDPEATTQHLLLQAYDILLQYLANCVTLVLLMCWPAISFRRNLLGWLLIRMITSLTVYRSSLLALCVY